MYPIILAQGIQASSTILGVSGDSQNILSIANSSGFIPTAPLIVRDNTNMISYSLGVAKSIVMNLVESAWAFSEFGLDPLELIQVSNYVVLPQHVYPLVHLEYQHGLTELESEAGAFHGIRDKTPVDILRLRIQQPQPTTAAELLKFIQDASGVESLKATMSGVNREVYSLTLLNPDIVVSNDQFRVGDPIDLMFRIDQRGLDNLSE